MPSLGKIAFRASLLGLFITVVASPQSREKRVAPVDSAARQSFDRQPKVAVLVGIGSYPDGAGLPPLKYPSRDVQDLGALLESQGYAVRQITDSQATRGVIERTLNQLAEVLDQNEGTLLFYFSGHGFADRGVNYLVPYGATIDDLKRDGLSLSELQDLINKTHAKRQLLFIDACRNDAGSGVRGVGARSFEHLDAAEGLRILYSTRAGSVSYEDDSLGHGVFTYFLLKGLQGAAAGSDGIVTFQDLAAYVSESILSYGVRSGRLQRPFDAGEGSGDFLIARVRSGRMESPVDPSIASRTSITNTGPSTNAPQPDGQFWDRIKNGSSALDFATYANAYPSGNHVTEARQRLAGLSATASKDAPVATANKSYRERAEYDLFAKATQTTDPKLRLQVLNEWQDKYPTTDFALERVQCFIVTLNQLAPTDASARLQLIERASEGLTRDPKYFAAAYYITLYGPQSPGTPDSKLQARVEDAAQVVILQADTALAANKKPANTSESDFESAKRAAIAIAYNAAAWVATARGDSLFAEAAYRASLQSNPDDARVAYSLGKLLIAQKKYPQGLFEVARAATYEGKGALNQDARNQVRAYFNTAYTTYHGSAEGADTVLAQAMSFALPPDTFRITSALEQAQAR